jgi:DNA-binding beta-propeller fold protein YncE
VFVVASGALLFNQGRRALQAGSAPAVPAIGELPVVQPPARGQLPTLELGDIRVFGREGTGPGQFKEPHGIAISPAGEIAVADTGNKRVQLLNANGQFLREIKAGREPLLQPMAVTYNRNGELVVLDSERATIERFGPDGRVLSTIDKLGYFPRGMNLDKDGNYLVADTGGSRVIRVSPTGQVLFGWGEKGKGAGQWTEPTDVLEDAEGNVYGVDPTNKVLQKFAADGRLLASVGIEGAGSVHGPKLAIEPGGTLLVSVPEQHIFRQYDRALKGMGEFGGPGSEPGRFRLPTSLTHFEGKLYLADSLNHRLHLLIGVSK